MARKWIVPGTVLEVVDGDTLRMQLDLGWHITYTTRVRIAHINAPELSTPEGIRARAYAQTLLEPGVECTLISTGLDKYGRPLGIVILPGMEGKDFGQAMLDAGHAVVPTYR